MTVKCLSFVVETMHVIIMRVVIGIYVCFESYIGVVKGIRGPSSNPSPDIWTATLPAVYLPFMLVCVLVAAETLENCQYRTLQWPVYPSNGSSHH